MILIFEIVVTIPLNNNYSSTSSSSLLGDGRIVLNYSAGAECLENGRNLAFAGIRCSPNGGPC